jgi:hypothetical protein
VLVGLGARAEWLAVAALAYVAQYAAELGLATTTAQRLGYGLAVAVVLTGWLVRRNPRARHVTRATTLRNQALLGNVCKSLPAPPDTGRAEHPPSKTKYR